jgi:hypothetical protein
VTYVALDDRFPRDDRVHGLTDRAFRLHVAALCMCSEDLTDGFISTSPRLGMLRTLTKATQRHVNELVVQGLWRPVSTGETFEVEGKDGAVSIVVKGAGYYLDGYLELNRSKGQVEALIEARREAGRQGGLAKALASATASAQANALAKTYPDTDTPTNHDRRARKAGRGEPDNGRLDELYANVGPDDIPEAGS